MENAVSPPIDFAETFRGRRVLVTGHTGFKGSWLALWLLELGAEVTGFALAPEYARSHFELLGLETRLRHIEGDIRDLPALEAAFDLAEPEIVFHLAAQALVVRSYAEPKLTFDTNVGGSVNVLEMVRRRETVRTLVFITSDKCYLNKEWVWGYRETDELGGHDPYSASKAAAEMLFMAYQHAYFSGERRIGAASTRAGNVIGGGDWAVDRIVPDCIRALESGAPISLRNPDATRPWQHVLDPLNGYLRLAAALETEPETYRGSWNFGPEIDSGKTVGELAEDAIREWGSGQTVVPSTENDRPFEHRFLQLNVDKAKLDLGWRPRWNADRAIAETVRWYKEVTTGTPADDVSRAQIKAFVGGNHD